MPLVVLTGPTASGKSALAMEVARRLPVELVTLDSAQVYRGMDIGTAKPDAAERAAVTHHLIDICDPAEVYSAARFAEDAAPLIASIRERGRVPLLVGGTLLYLRALLEGLSALPSADAALRAALSARAAASGSATGSPNPAAWGPASEGLNSMTDPPRRAEPPWAINWKSGTKPEKPSGPMKTERSTSAAPT